MKQQGHTYIYLKQWFILYPLQESFKSSTLLYYGKVLSHLLPYITEKL